MINLMTGRRRVATLIMLSALLACTVAWGNSAAFAQLELNNPLSAAPTRPAAPTLSAAPSLAQPTDDFDVLTRGPMHEAFASAHQSNPEASPSILAAPPTPIDEVPPEYKPEGNNVQWIPGYWAWDEAQQDYIWISGIWRDTPPRRSWMPGYWDKTASGYRWIAGFWAEQNQQELGYLPQPPASIDQGPSTVAPDEQHFYVPGNWEYQDDRYRWATGHWQPMAENWIWIPASYIWTPNGCVYQSGYWDYEFDKRGTCFAPVHFNRPVYDATNYQYQPSFAINLNIDFLTHLFVRPHCNHYYYGDWYSSNFTNLGFQPWVSYRSHQGYYDPLLAYYGHRRSSFDNRYNTVQYLAQQHRFYVDHQAYRPRPTFAAQFSFFNSFQGQPNLRYRDYVGKSNYVRSYSNHRNSSRQTAQFGNDFRSGQRQLSNFRRIQEEELRANRRRVEQLAKIQRERKQREIRLASSKSPRRSAGFRPDSFSIDRSNDFRQGQRNGNFRSSADLSRLRAEQDRRARDLERVRDQERRVRDQERRARDRENANLVAQARNQADRQRREIEQRRERQERELRDQQRQRTSDLARQQRERQRRESDQARQQSRTDQRVRSELARQTRSQDAARRAQESQRDASRRAQQDIARRAEQRSRQDADRRAEQRSQQDAARRAQQKAQQDAARRAQQRSQEASARRDAARRAQQKSQQDAARRSQQKIKDSARRASDARRDAARAKQKSQLDAARRAQKKARSKKK